MPVYHFTFHAYGSWLPDKPKGYVQRNQGVLPPDPAAAAAYRSRMTQPQARFNPAHQIALFKEVIKGQSRQHYRVLAAAMEASHIHLVIAWEDKRGVGNRRAQIKSAMTRCLNTQFGKMKWFLRNASQKRITDPRHLDHLNTHYLPSHRGLFWREGMKTPRPPRSPRT